MADLIKSHPALNFAQDIADICQPLKQLNISYFSHVHIDNTNKFSTLNNNPNFIAHYLNNKYYNVDIHMAEPGLLGDYIVWDAIECDGQTAKMDEESVAFGIKHTFTIIEKNNTGHHYYHFANNSSNQSINQIYVANIDLLKLFILHFKDKIRNSKQLSQAYDLKFNLDHNAEGYTLKTDIHDVSQELRKSLFLNKMGQINSFDPNIIKPLSHREIEILAWLHHGKKVNDIAKITGLAEVTVNKHITNIKEKTQCYTPFQLGELFSTMFHHSNDVIDVILKSKDSK